MTPVAAIARSVRLAGSFAVVAVVALVVLVAASGWTAGSAAASGCGPAPTGSIATMMVVDNGGTTSQRCVVVPDRSTGYDALRAAGHQLRIESGFLCAIDGLPATGCANQPGFDGSYWRYFHAAPGGGWTYSTVGGGGYRLPARCAIEGWRWSTSRSDSTPPRVSPPPVTCETPPTVPPTAPRPTSAPTPPAGGAPGTPPGGSGGAAPSPGTDPGVVPAVPAEGGADGTGAPGAEGDRAGGPGATDAGGATTVPGAPTTTVAGGGSADDSAGGGGSGDDVENDGGNDAAVEQAEGVAVSASSEGSSPVGLIAGLAAICAIGGAAVYRTRRRSVETSAR